jgi:hypothetical protein
MKADMWPTIAATTMSTPFIEMPQRELASALDDEQAAAAGGAGILGSVAGDAHAPDIMFSATPGPALAMHVTRRGLFMPAQ